MATLSKSRIFASKRMDSKIHSANTTKSEGFLGYFLGPCFAYMVYYAVAGSYLTQFYTDVLGLSGWLLTAMPVFSKIVDAITNILMGRLIDKTRTRQGKARPWIFISGILMAITGFLLYAVPRAGYRVQIVWVIVSYNLFFAFAFTIYNMSHMLMVPLSTRNTKQRDGLAMLTSTGTTMIPGLLTMVIMPVLVNTIGVGDAARSTWLTMMSVISILAIPATLIEYYFTKERVTEDTVAEEKADQGNSVSFAMQLKACFRDKYWLIVMGFVVVYNILNNLFTNVQLYYCNWVLASSVEQGTGLQVLCNAVGQAPLGLGIFILWPLVRKFGKRRVMQVGFHIATLGSLLILFAGSNFPLVLVGLVIRSFGALPTYTMMAQLAESLDHIEYTNGYRADGISASIYAIILTVTAGLAQTIILSGINNNGYIVPTSNVEVIAQPEAMKTFFTVCFAGVPALGFLIGSLLMIPFDVEKKMPQITVEITARAKAAAEARGEVYYTPEEKAAMEQAEQDRIAEENRIKELKALCEKNGWDFAVEEAKYQAEKAVKDEEERLKQAVKAAKGAEKKAKKMELRAHQEKMKKQK